MPRIEDVSPDDAGAFMDVEWPRHDEGLGIRWSPVEVRLGVREAGALVGGWPAPS